MKWAEGKNILQDENQDYGLLEGLTICKLFTLIIRSDRFTEGTLVGCFEKGQIQKMVLALKEKVISKEWN